MSINFSRLVLIFIFLVMPFFDMLNGYLVINKIIAEGGVASPSQLARIIALFLLTVILYHRKLNIKYVFLVFLYFLAIDISSSIVHQVPSGAISSIINSSKMFYLLLLIFVIPNLIKSEPDFNFFVALIKYNIYLISFSILISFVFGIGNSTYGWGLGTKGFFASGNSLGVYLGTLSILLMSLKKNNIYTDINNFLFIFVIASILLLGSKTALLLASVLLLYWVGANKLKYILLAFMVVFLTIYANVIISYASDLFEVIIARYEVSDDLISFVGSGRIDYVLDAFSIFNIQSPSFLRYVFGMGAFISFQDPNALHLIYDTLETDLFDVFFMYGAVGSILYIAMFLIGIRMMFNHLFLLVPFCFLFFHSLFAGHVIFNGMSALAISIFYTIVIYLRREEYVKSNN